MIFSDPRSVSPSFPAILVLVFLSINSQIHCSLGLSLQASKGRLRFTEYSKMLSSLTPGAPPCTPLTLNAASLVPAINQKRLQIMRIRSDAVKEPVNSAAINDLSVRVSQPRSCREEKKTKKNLKEQISHSQKGREAIRICPSAPTFCRAALNRACDCERGDSSLPPSST